MRVLVTGGAGYIGAHICKSIAAQGWTPVAYDNLSSGHIDAARFGPFVHGDTSDVLALSDALDDCDAVVHCAAHISVADSVKEPDRYYRNNALNTVNILDVITRINPQIKFVFSSSCAVYAPSNEPLREDSPCRPTSPYGRSKHMAEQVIEDYTAAYGLQATILRYFNAVGAHPSGDIGEDHTPETHLLPQLLIRLLRQPKGRIRFQIHGQDYPTRDGTPIRDYVHVCDLAEAHVLAVRRLLEGERGGVFNLGTGQGRSVLEVIEAVREVTGRDISISTGPRRPSDPMKLVSEFGKAREVLGWTPKREFKQAVLDAWRWHQIRHSSC